MVETRAKTCGEHNGDDCTLEVHHDGPCNDLLSVDGVPDAEPYPEWLRTQLREARAPGYVVRVLSFRPHRAEIAIAADGHKETLGYWVFPDPPGTVETVPGCVALYAKHKGLPNPYEETADEKELEKDADRKTCEVCGGAIAGKVERDGGGNPVHPTCWNELRCDGGGSPDLPCDGEHSIPCTSPTGCHLKKDADLKVGDRVRVTGISAYHGRSGPIVQGANPQGPYDWVVECGVDRVPFKSGELERVSDAEPEHFKNCSGCSRPLSAEHYEIATPHDSARLVCGDCKAEHDRAPKCHDCEGRFVAGTGKEDDGGRWRCTTCQADHEEYQADQLRDPERGETEVERLRRERDEWRAKYLKAEELRRELLGRPFEVMTTPASLWDIRNRNDRDKQLRAVFGTGYPEEGE